MRLVRNGPRSKVTEVLAMTPQIAVMLSSRLTRRRLLFWCLSSRAVETNPTRTT